MDVKSFYDKHAATYDERHDNLRTRYMRELENSLIKKFAKGRVLDIGSGTGNNLLTAVGLDISSAMLKEARKKGYTLLAQGAAESLPFRDSSFDTILCTFTVLNLCDYQKAAKEMRRALKRGGIAIISASSMWDNSKAGLLRRTLTEGKPRFLKMRIEGVRFKFFGFSKKNLIQAFRGFALRHFYGAYMLIMPYWGWHRDFSVTEKARLKIAFAIEKLLQPFNRAARMYFAVFRKT